MASLTGPSPERPQSHSSYGDTRQLADDLPGYELERVDVIEERDQPALTQSIWRSQSRSVRARRITHRRVSRSNIRSHRPASDTRTVPGISRAPRKVSGMSTLQPRRRSHRLRAREPGRSPAHHRRETLTSVPLRKRRAPHARPTGRRPAASRPRSTTWQRVRHSRSGTIPISIEATDPLGRPLWFKMFGQEGEALERNGELAFRPYGPKRWALTVFAINENGASSEKTLSASAR